MKNVLFFSHVKDLSLFNTVAYYEQDIRALTEIGYDVQVTNKIHHLFFKECDFIFVWWWTYSIFPIMAGFLRKKKVIIEGAFHYRTPLMAGTDYVRRSFLYKFLVRIGLYFANANIFISDAEFVEVKLYFPIRNPYIIPLVIDSLKYAPKFKKVEKKSRTKKTYNLTVISWLEKNNVERKRILQLLDVVKNLSDLGLSIHFDICGRKGNGYELLAERVNKLNIGRLVTFHGNVTEERKIQILQNTDLYLAPTLYEGFGLAIAEAMSCECAVLTSSNGAITEVVGDAGIYVDPLSVEDMVKASYAILSDHKKRLLLGKIARKRILDSFHMDQKKQSIKRVLTELNLY